MHKIKMFRITHTWIEKKITFGLLAGFNFPVGNRVINNSIKTLDNTMSFASGIVSTYQITNKFAIFTSFGF